MDSQPEILSPLRNPLMSKTSIEEDKLLFRKPVEQDHTRSFTKLIIVSVLCVIFIVGEIIGGIIANSIAVISDAMHLITDFFGFILSFVFLYYSSKKSTTHKTFGFHRLEVVGALANLFIIWSVALYLFVESTTRIINKEFVQQPKVMLIVAVSGLCVNIGMYFILHSGGGHSHGLGQQCSSGHGHGHGQAKKVEKIPDFTIKVQSISGVINDEKETDSIVLKVEEEKKQSGHEHSHEHCRCTHKHEDNSTHDHSHQSHQGHNHEEHSHDHNHGHHDHKAHAHHDQHVHAQHSHGHHEHHGHGHGHGPGHDCHHDHDDGHQHTDSPISMKAAVLHAITDIIQSIGLVISSLIIFFVGSDHGNPVTQWNAWHLLDPVVTYVFSIMVVYSTWPITKLCYNIILEATPSDVHPEQIKSQFLESKQVKGMHDFHLWQLKPGKLVLTAHVSADKGKQRQVLRHLTKICRRNKIYHSTIQIQRHDLLGKDGYIKCDNDID